jgi:hypothetical protein
MAQVIKHLPSMLNFLGSIPTTEEQQKQYLESGTEVERVQKAFRHSRGLELR